MCHELQNNRQYPLFDIYYSVIIIVIVLYIVLTLINIKFFLRFLEKYIYIYMSPVSKNYFIFHIVYVCLDVTLAIENCV